ncbi:MAG: hypothetical protein OEZ01_07865 [Candidatus Heimdallarchaeota archaeon]|nr:hypothetical protein [Candidatus Heimdallarchaeota archaeon]MDH5645908.1 hypothetical protein [Candidatus Heimdallarchaeota archaeon]
MEPNNENNEFDLGELFKIETKQTKLELIKILFVGQSKEFQKFKRYLDKNEHYDYHQVSDINEGITYLLQEIFSIVILDNDSEFDIITTSRVVRINHPLARIVVVSRKRNSTLISNIINHGSVDCFLPKPVTEKDMYKMVSEQNAKHEINKMITTFVTKPPKLSKASYLLLDPTLSFNEEEPARFVGMMITHKTVPRYTKFFEELLQNDAVLFAGFLSGISIMGQELFTSKEPLKEINFGGISVIFRFYEEVQFSIFVRNLSNWNYEETEEEISELMTELIINHIKDIKKHYLSDVVMESITQIVIKLKESNDRIAEKIELKNKEIPTQTILVIGSDDHDNERIKRHLETKHEYIIEIINTESQANEFLNYENCNVIIMDADLGKETDDFNPLHLAEYAKDASPHLQIIYRVRDKRASDPIIASLNSGVINFLLSYKASLKELETWLAKAVEKANSIKSQSKTSEGLESNIDRATIAKTMIRRNEESYISESFPVLIGAIITENEGLIFEHFWNEDAIGFDKSLLAGLVFSLDAAGEEMLIGADSLGNIDLGGATIMIEHRGIYNFAFFISNLDHNTSVIVKRELVRKSDEMYEIVKGNQDKLLDPIVQKEFKKSTDEVYKRFLSMFS